MERRRIGPEAPMALEASHRVAVFWEHLTAVDRLNEVVPPLLEGDRRLEILHVLPRGTSRFADSVARYVRDFDGRLVTWEWATDGDRRFDLVLAANSGYDSSLERLPGPVLRLSHGAGFGKLHQPGLGSGPPLRRPPVTGAVPSTLVRHGRVVAAAIGVAHEDQRRVLAEAVPEATEVVHVIGDPAYDRAVAALPRRRELRRAMGVRDKQRLVLLSSTWGPGSLFGTHPELLDRAVAELPADHVAVAVLHPGLWVGYGPRRIKNCFREARERGLRILAPNSPWLGALVAADTVIGDHGSVTYYGAALGADVLLVEGRDGETAPGSPMAELQRRAPRLDPDRPLGAQVATAVQEPGKAEAHAGLLTSVPGRSAKLLRALCYDLMGLPEPDTPPVLDPISRPRFVPGEGDNE